MICLLIFLAVWSLAVLATWEESVQECRRKRREAEEKSDRLRNLPLCTRNPIVFENGPKAKKSCNCEYCRQWRWRVYFEAALIYNNGSPEPKDRRRYLDRIGIIDDFFIPPAPDHRLFGQPIDPTIFITEADDRLDIPFFYRQLRQYANRTKSTRSQANC